MFIKTEYIENVLDGAFELTANMTVSILTESGFIPLNILLKSFSESEIQNKQFSI